jgi:dihydrofolate synthase/folylpolyglutamate synthase
MFGLRRFGIKLGLSTIRRILAGLGNPQHRFRCVHIAGTNGKGSVASALASVLGASGYRVGLYTSPHLVRFNERIRVDGREITDADTVRLFRRVRKMPTGSREPTFFEFTTAMALVEFARRKVDWAVIETGMGGRLDATNVVAPELSVITNISLEHREYLGSTIARIALEKAGIIKRRTPVVTGVRQPSARAVVAQVAEAKSAPLYRFGKEFRIRRMPDGAFSYHGIGQRWTGLRTALEGDHQLENAALVLAACALLIPKAPRITIENIRTGLAETRWPGRLEVVCRRPLVMFDGAHNLEAAKRLAQHLRVSLAGRELTLVIGILDDKPHAAMLGLLLPLARRVIFTAARTSRALPPETLAAAARGLIEDITVVPAVADALRHALGTAAPDGLTLVAGSLYVVGEAKEAVETRSVTLGEDEGL